MPRSADLRDQPADQGGDRFADEHELLISVAARLNRTSAVLLSALDVPLTFRQYRTLTRVMGGYTSLRQLAKRGNLTLPTVSENVDGLVKRGLMATSQNAADRRAIVLHVTDEGRAAAEIGHRVITEFTESLLADLSSERRRELHAALQIIDGSATTFFAQRLAADSDRPVS